MKTKHYRALAATVALLVCSAMLMGMGVLPNPQGTFAEVVKVSIQDRQVIEQNKPVIVTFSEEMVLPETLSKPVPAKDMPFQIEPAVPGEGRWLTQNSFAFAPENGFLRGTTYQLVLSGTLRSLKGNPVRYLFSFKTQNARVQSLQPGEYHREKNNFDMAFEFNLPVSAQAVREHIALTDADSGEALTYTMKEEPGEATSHRLRAHLGKERAKIRIALRTDAAGDKAPLGLASAYSSDISMPKKDADGGEGSVAKVEGGESTPSDLYITTSYNDTADDGAQYVVFHLNKGLAAQNQKDFISLTPDLPYTIGGDNDSIRVSQGLTPGMRVTLTLKQGTVDSAGQVLNTEKSETDTVSDIRPTVGFAAPGSFLTPKYGSRVALSLVNVDKVTLRLQRQYDNNLPFMSSNPEYHATKMMRNLAFKEVEIKAKKNERLRRAVDIEELSQGKRGVFRLTLAGYVEEADDNGQISSRYTSSQERLVVLSDIGVTARVFPSGLTVFASGISTAKPLADARIKVYSESNQLVLEGKTDSNGLFTYTREQAWDPQLRPNVITVAHGEGDTADLTFLPLEDATSVRQDDPATREYLDKGFEAYAYTPRGVFRPGETVDVKAFVRDADHMPPAPFPVLFRVVSSRGLEVTRGSATLSDEGGADFSFALQKSAPTGEYTAFVEIPGQKNAKSDENGELGRVSFQVEDFVPPRLEVSVTPGAQRLTTNSTLPVQLSGQYLFGAPGADLKYELGFRVAEQEFAPEEWKGYSFGDAERRFDPQTNLKYITGALDKAGKAEVAFKAPSDWVSGNPLNVLLVSGVQEDGGRWVNQTGSFTYFPTPYLLGLKAESDSFEPGKPAALKVAAVTPDGKTTDAGSLTAEVFLAQGNWYTVYREGRYVYTWDERLIPQTKAKVTTKNGLGEYAFTPRQHGRYLVRLTSADGKVTGSSRINVWLGGEDGQGGEDGAGRMDKVELTLDKKEYREGETARLSIKSPFAGTLLLGVERSAQLSTRIIELEQPATVVDIPVTRGMDPNATVTAWVFRPVKDENREWFSHRAHGRISLAMSKAPHTLSVTALTPERALPDKPLRVPFAVTDEKGDPVRGEFSVALIDEGILSLTAFKTPDPTSFFMQMRRGTSLNFDLFDALLRPEAKATPLLTAGGDGSGNYLGALSSQQIFLTAYLPTVRTDENGRGVAEFQIPEYSGKGRLMVVGASKNRFASMAAPVPVARDVVVEASAPRAVAPGDTFEVSVKAFTPAGAAGLEGTARLRVSALGPVRLSGNLETTLPLNPKAGTGNNAGAGATDPAAPPLAVTAEALRESGIATITIAVDVPGRDDLTFSKTVEVVVRPPYPRTSAVVTTLIAPGKEETLILPGKWLKGSFKTSFSLDKSPVLAVLPALDYLREYPYGCLEQTVSRAWPYLTLTEVQKVLYPDQDGSGNVKAVLGQAVARIGSMQTPEGGFAMWPGNTQPSEWNSVGATFFLLEAKAQVPVPKSTLDQALKYMRFLLAAPAGAFSDEDEGNVYSTKAYAAFVLTRANEAPLGWIQHLSEKESKLWPSGRIFLAGAKALKAGNPDALRALDKANLAIDQKAERASRNTSSMESNLRNTALRLYMWTLVAPAAPETSRLSARVAADLGKARWLTTQDAGTAALALGSFLEKTGGAGPAYTAEISSAGKVLAKAAKGERVLLNSDTLAPKADGTPPDLRVAVSGGNAYCVYSVRGVPLEAPAPKSEHLSVQRVWKDADGKVIDLSTGRTKVAKGDRIFVELTVKTGDPVSRLVISDLLPGGFEVENPRLNTAADDSDNEEEASASGAGIFMDLREDRLLLFIDRVESEMTHKYSLRAVSKGTFVLPPLAAEGMYAPEAGAITGTGSVTVE